MNIGDRVFFVDFIAEKVDEGVIVGNFLSKQGYIVCEIKVASGVKQKWADLVFSSKQEAEEAFAIYGPLITKMKKIQEKAKLEVDIIVTKILGKPKFKYLLDNDSNKKTP